MGKSTKNPPQTHRFAKWVKHISKIKPRKSTWLSMVLLFALSVSFSFAMFRYFTPTTDAQIIDEQGNIVVLPPSPTPDPLAPYNVLLLGYGGAGHDGGEITDTIMMLHIRPREQKVVTISIPRDLWVPLDLNLDNPVYKKINHAYALGNDLNQYQNRNPKYLGVNSGINLANDTVELITGKHIRHTLAVNFAIFEEAINTLGGLNVDVPVGFVDEFFPIKGEEDNPCDKSEEEIAELTATMSGYLLEQQFPCRYERLEFNSGEQLMDGATALKFVRSRHSNTAGNDFNRTMRQQALIKALKKKATSLEGALKAFSTLKVVFKNINTDLNFDDITQILTSHGNLKDYQIDSVILSTDNVLIEARSSDRQYILIPKTGDQDWPSLHEFIDLAIASASAQKVN